MSVRTPTILTGRGNVLREIPRRSRLRPICCRQPPQGRRSGVKISCPRVNPVGDGARRGHASGMVQSILQRVAVGDAGAMRACVDQFGGLVWSLARRMAPQEAEDATQEIFLDLWRSAARYDPSVASEATFVSMIARRRLIDRLRRIETRLRPQAIAEQDPPAPTRFQPAMEVSEEASIARSALESLPADQQRVLRLSVDLGLSHDEIATATGLPLGTVKTHIRRGLIRIRELLESRSDAQAAAPAVIGVRAGQRAAGHEGRARP